MLSQLSDFVMCSTNLYIWSSRVYILRLDPYHNTSNGNHATFFLDILNYLLINKYSSSDT